MNTLLSIHPQRPTARVALSLLAALVCFTASPVRAESRYVKPTLEIAVRQTQSNTGKIIANVPLGTQVELIQGEKEWSLIRLQNAAEGWVRSRYLSTSPILPSDILKSSLEGQPVDPQTKARDLNEENSRLRKEMAVCATERSTLADKYQTLVSDSDNVMHTKTSLGEAQRQVEELQAKLATVQIENTVLKKNESIKWFLVGSSVLLFGWFIGRVSNGQRKKKSSLLS